MSEYGKNTGEYEKKQMGEGYRGNMGDDLSAVKQCLERALEKINRMSGGEGMQSWQVGMQSSRASIEGSSSGGDMDTTGTDKENIGLTRENVTVGDESRRSKSGS